MVPRSATTFLYLVLMAITLSGQAVPITPTLPQSVPPSTQPTVTGIARPVHDTGNISTNGSHLQTMYSTTANCGDQIVLDAGVTYSANFVFNRVCNGSNWIQVVSANLASVPIPTYATIAQANAQDTPPSPPTTSNLAKIISSNGGQVFACTNGSNVPGAYNYFGGLEVTNTQGAGLVGCTNELQETLVSQLPNHYIFDRLYVHGVHGSSAYLFT